MLLQTSTFSPFERIREGAGGPGQDPLDRILDQVYYTNHSWREFREHVAPGRTDRAIVSRYYPKLNIAVDFESKGRIWNPEAARRWCHLQQIVYVPVYLTERLTPEEFINRLEIEKKAMKATTGAPVLPEDMEPVPAGPMPGAEPAPVHDQLMEDPSVVIALTEAAETRTNGQKMRAARVGQEVKALKRRLQEAMIDMTTDGTLDTARQQALAWIAAQRK